MHSVKQFKFKLKNNRKKTVNLALKMKSKSPNYDCFVKVVQHFQTSITLIGPGLAYYRSFVRKKAVL
jgi:hypothetical protein